MKRVVPALLSIAAVWALYWCRANVWIRLYPALVVACVWTAFAVSLFKTPLAEIFARKMGETLDDRGVRYCRTVTRVWVVFLTVHFFLSLATAFMSHEVWAFYNGCLAYVLLGAMFLGEWICRRRMKRG